MYVYMHNICEIRDRTYIYIYIYIVIACMLHSTMTEVAWHFIDGDVFVSRMYRREPVLLSCAQTVC